MNYLLTLVLESVSKYNIALSLLLRKGKKQKQNKKVCNWSDGL
jgi:hypothetical protein